MTNTDQRTQTAKTLTRRQAVGLLATGVISAAALALPGCSPIRRGLRDKTITDLLKEKYDREFEVVYQTRGYSTSTRPRAYCCERGVDDLVFQALFDANKGEILRDEFVWRKLGRQVEDVVTECFAAHGIKAAPNGIINTHNLYPHPTPDANVADLANVFEEEELQASLCIVISDEIETPRTSPQLMAAFRDVRDALQTYLGSHVYVVSDDEFEVYRQYMRNAPCFDSELHPEWSVLDCFIAKVYESETVIEEDNLWTRFQRR